ncbi:MAG: hypothetical protein JRH11_06930 [Deltaproteobacteria bacterium]|nr:hypothetical protein [Deltaproteobacteria bacterium]
MRSRLTLSFAISSVLLLGTIISVPGSARAQQALTGSNTIAYDFASYTAAGFSPSPTAGQLDSDEWVATRVNALDLDFGGTSSNMDFANGTSPGGERAGGIWAFTPVTSMCSGSPRTLLGVQPSNRTFSPGSFRLQVLNSTGAPLTEVYLSYALAWLNNEDRSVVQGVRALQVDASGAATGTVAVASLIFETPVAASAAPSWQGACQSARIDLSSIPIADGAPLVIVFDVDDGSGSGSRDELGITDVRIGTMAFGDAGVPPTDAGTPADSGTDPDAGAADSGAGDSGADDAGAYDGGSPPDDAGPTMDTGVTPTPDAGDAAFDSGAPGTDTGSGTPDGGTDPGASSGGCDCSTVDGRGAPVWMAALALLLLGRQRRRQHP